MEELEFVVDRAGERCRPVPEGRDGWETVVFDLVDSEQQSEAGE